MLLHWNRHSCFPGFKGRDYLKQNLSTYRYEIDVWFNGCITNSLELLARAGMDDDTNTHQLLIELYNKYGMKAANYIAGPISWALWDGNRNELLLVRDRIGNFGFFYFLQDETIVIADRIEILLEKNRVSPKFSVPAITAYMNGHFPSANETFYEGIFAVPPSTILFINPERIKSERYWNLNPGNVLKCKSDDEYADAFRSLFFSIIREYIPDSKLGITLSGGLDSTSIAAAIRSTVAKADLTALRWVAPELTQADEDFYSKQVCQRYDIPSVDIRADLNWPLCYPDGLKTMRAIPFSAHYDEIWNTTFLNAQVVGIKVLYSGDGGDLLFGGNVFAYPDLFLTGQWVELVRQIKQHVRISPHNWRLHQIVWNLLLRPLIRTSPLVRKKPVSTVPWIREPYKRYFIEHIPIENCIETRIMLLPGRRQRLDYLHPPRYAFLLERMNDHASKYSIDFRHPWLDHRLLEFAANLPTTQTFRACQRKIIVRNAMRGFLPEDILNMVGKIYPTAIFERGVREREHAKVWKLLTNMRTAELGIVDEKNIQQFYRDYLDGKHDRTTFWQTLCVEDWLRRYF